MANTAHSYQVQDIRGKSVNLKTYEGKVLLIVNTASECGFTPQYAGLQALHEKYGARGLVVMAFPANDYGAQEPGTDADIAKFCDLRFHVKFPLMSKVTVKGAGKAPLFKFLTEEAGQNGEIKWNFEKFLIGKDGRLLKRFDSKAEPTSTEITAAVEGALK
jgi:glutathione peroxidase